MTTIRTVRGTLPGLEGEHDIAVLEGDTHISKWVEEARRLDHDQNALPVIGQLITPESVVWDVGAFIGDHTAFYASKAREVLAIEAASDAFDCLIRNTRKYPRVMCLREVIGDGLRNAAFAPDIANKGARWLIQSAAPVVHGIETVKLDVIGGEPPTLIKLDIEGWEVRALRGAERTLREYHPTLVVEVCRETLERAGTSPEELHDLLRHHGYEMTDLFTGMGWFPEDPCPQFDVVCRWRP